jgi:hypothetical protein
MTSREKTAALERHLGPQGRLVSRSKSGYRETFPDHLVIFNAQIVVDGETLYHGDLDLTVDETLLKSAAREVGELYVLTEHETLDLATAGRPRRHVYWTDGIKRGVGDGYWKRFGWDGDALRMRPHDR